MSDFFFVGLQCCAAVMASSREHLREDDVGDLDSSFSELWIEGYYHSHISSSREYSREEAITTGRHYKPTKKKSLFGRTPYWIEIC